jgi:hypothetical protein
MAGTGFKVEALIENRYRVLAVIDGGEWAFYTASPTKPGTVRSSRSKR